MFKQSMQLFSRLVFTSTIEELLHVPLLATTETMCSILHILFFQGSVIINRNSVFLNVSYSFGAPHTVTLVLFNIPS